MGDWCPPTCTAKCGQLILAEASRAEDVAYCFEKSCKCNLPEDNMIDPVHFAKYKEDMRVENLILQKEIGDIVMGLQNSSMLPVEAASNIYYQTQPNFDIKNVYLENLVEKALLRSTATGLWSQYHSMMYLCYLFLGVSVLFLLLAIALLVGAKIMKVDDSSKECRFIRQDHNWREAQRQIKDQYVDAMAKSKPKTQEKMSQLNRLNENLLEHKS